MFTLKSYEYGRLLHAVVAGSGKSMSDRADFDGFVIWLLLRIRWCISRCWASLRQVVVFAK